MPTPNDEAAMRLAIEMQIARGGERRRQIEDMLKHDPWESVGKFASYSCQIASLRLEPWELASVAVDADNPDAGRADVQRASDGRYEAAALLREMLSLGISRWHPDPKAAIAEAKRKRKPAAVT